jgi:hypothetical protein
MPDIMVVVACVSQWAALTTLCHLGRVIAAMLAISGRVSMRGLCLAARLMRVWSVEAPFDYPAHVPIRA